MVPIGTKEKWLGKTDDHLFKISWYGLSVSVGNNSCITVTGR
jgi:hypothetical protein